MIRPIAFLCITASIIVLAACNGEPAASVNSVTGRYNFGVLRYDSAAVEYRLDSIHNRQLILQFMLPQAGDNNTAFQLISYAYDTLKDYNNSWIPDTLQLVRDSIPRTFTGKLTVGNNMITREQLLNVLRDENGNRFSYDYLLFTPTVEGVFHHVVYLLRPVKNDKIIPGRKMQMTSPLPPTRIWE